MVGRSGSNRDRSEVTQALYAAPDEMSLVPKGNRGSPSPSGRG
jgi:hypothetical protein